MDRKLNDGKTHQIDPETLVGAFEEWRERLVEAWNRGALNDFVEMLDEGPILINPRLFLRALRRAGVMTGPVKLVRKK